MLIEVSNIDNKWNFSWKFVMKDCSDVKVFARNLTNSSSYFYSEVVQKQQCKNDFHAILWKFSMKFFLKKFRCYTKSIFPMQEASNCHWLKKLHSKLEFGAKQRKCPIFSLFKGYVPQKFGHKSYLSIF